eukprot:15452747-Alexandrium_andersonii.AAC.1
MSDRAGSVLRVRRWQTLAPPNCRWRHGCAPSSTLVSPSEGSRCECPAGSPLAGTGGTRPRE